MSNVHSLGRGRGFGDGGRDFKSRFEFRDNHRRGRGRRGRGLWRRRGDFGNHGRRLGVRFPWRVKCGRLQGELGNHGHGDRDSFEFGHTSMRRLCAWRGLRDRRTCCRGDGFRCHCGDLRRQRRRRNGGFRQQGRGRRRDVRLHGLPVGNPGDGVGEGGGRGIASGRVLGKGFEHDVVEKLGECRLPVAGRRGGLAHMGHHEFELAPRLKGRAAGEHLVEHDAERVEVAAWIQTALALYLLGRDIAGVADDGADAGLVSGIDRTGQRETGEFAAAARAEQDVLGSNVAVHKGLLVHAGEGVEQLVGDV